MAFVLDAEKFKSELSVVSDCKECDVIYTHFLKSMEPEEASETCRVLDVAVNVMAAENVADLADISLADIIKTLKYHQHFEHYFCSGLALPRLLKVKKKIGELKSMRKRRVL